MWILVQLTLAAAECFPKEDGDKGVDDMTKLSFLDEPGVLHNLYLRYQNKQIYVRPFPSHCHSQSQPHIFRHFNSSQSCTAGASL